ncbi:MAG: hypothetical protein K2H67_00985 [Treponemataceae bacterium]|nr:hypothetical protein [Treponemataceae bacterium]
MSDEMLSTVVFVHLLSAGKASTAVFVYLSSAGKEFAMQDAFAHNGGVVAAGLLLSTRFRIGKL